MNTQGQATMQSNNLIQELQNICFHASIGMGTYDDVNDWLLQYKTNHDFLSSEEVIQLLFKCKAPLYIITTLLNILPEPGKILGDNGQHLLHIACSFGASLDIVKILYDINPKIISTYDNDGNLPLHLACQRNSCNKIIDFLIEKYAAAVQLQNHHGHTPLHLACGNKNSTTDTIRMLVTLYPNASKTVDNNGELPIHFECSKEEIVLENLSALLDANPNCVWVENFFGITPAYNCKSINENKFHDLIKEAIVQGLSVNVIKLLSKNFLSTAGSWRDEDGNHLLHHACMKTGTDISPDIITFLVTLSPEKCNSLNNDGYSPRDLLRETATYKDESGMLLLHHIAKTYMVTAKVIEFVVDAYPCGIYTSDNNGMLPFHHGLLNFWIWDFDVVYTLLRLYPDAVAKK